MQLLIHRSGGNVVLLNAGTLYVLQYSSLNQISRL